MLIRQKKGVNPQNRLDQLFTSKLFDLLKKQKNEVHKKVFAIHGDIEEPMLGIAEKDQQLLIEEVKILILILQKLHLSSQVEIVFHCAATVRFDEDLSRAIKMNIGAVFSLVELCKAMTRLVSLVHVSTAYCHCQQQHIEVTHVSRVNNS